MSPRTPRDLNSRVERVARAVEVTAESLYEAVARGLAAIRGHDWVAGIRESVVKVSVAEIRVEQIHRANKVNIS